MPIQITDIQLERLKNSLPLYRKILGYSAEKLGSYIGLKRQQISSLETGRTKLTQIHFRAISQIISEIIGEKMENNESNIALFIIQILIWMNEDDLNDIEFNCWIDVLVQFSNIKDVGDSDNQVKLLKGFALAMRDLDEGEIIPTIELLDEIVFSFQEFVQKMNEMTSVDEDIKVVS